MQRRGKDEWENKTQRDVYFKLDSWPFFHKNLAEHEDDNYDH